MKKETFADLNKVFFSHDLVEYCLRTTSFSSVCRFVSSQSEAYTYDEVGEYLVDGEPDIDGTQQFTFGCQDSGFAHLLFSVKEAIIIVSDVAGPSFVAQMVPQSIAGALSDVCEFVIERYCFSFRIIRYEIPVGQCSGHTHVLDTQLPWKEVRDTVPIDRYVILTVIDMTEGE